MSNETNEHDLTGDDEQPHDLAGIAVGEADPTMVSTDKLRTLVRLHEEIDSVERELRKLKADKEEVARAVDEELASSGAQAVSLDGYTIYRRARLLASVPPQNRAAVVAALESMGLGELVTTGVNSSTLSAQVREWSRELGIPAEVRDLINVYEQRFVSVLRKAT